MPRPPGCPQAYRQVLRQATTVIDVARQNDLTPRKIQGWAGTFLKAGKQELKAAIQGWIEFFQLNPKTYEREGNRSGPSGRTILSNQEISVRHPCP